MATEDPMKLQCMDKFAMISEDYAVLKNEMRHNNEMTTAILEAVKGNGKAGLATDIAVAKSSIKRAWWWLSSVSLAILAICIWAIKRGV